VRAKTGHSNFRVEYSGNVKFRDGKAFNASFWMNKGVPTSDKPEESKIVGLLAKAVELLPE